jgi:hypothetical protein
MINPFGVVGLDEGPGGYRVGDTIGIAVRDSRDQRRARGDQGVGLRGELVGQ